ncbi:response regulator transcription factor [Cohnella sp. LGH]|uniref:response regulator transcription factor n=1 Tax=Cohnella sp. LGH TaxID=1619153 RepID=UPI001ADD029E|nr:response regulator transcription factor [Cohnella sp. LGH]QTH45144.1 response regulator transcription factor [Cohnella sp. LGH]
MAVNILIVDDDPDIVELMRFYLQREGYSVVAAADGVQALELAEEKKADLAIIDIMMPKMDGWALCEQLKTEYPDMPVIMVTAKGETGHKLKGFHLGADDYLVKPFEPLELAARVKSLLRRYRIQSQMKVQIGNVMLDKHRYAAIVGGEDELDSPPIALPLREFDLLFKLASHPGQIFTRNDLIEQVWGADFEGDDRTVDVHIKRIRDRFVELDCRFVIETKRGLGYKLEVAE